MKQISSTSVSCRGDREYISQLKALAALKNITLADLTRQALDAAYGDDLKRQASFFKEGVASKQQTSSKRRSTKIKAEAV